MSLLAKYMRFVRAGARPPSPGFVPISDREAIGNRPVDLFDESEWAELQRLAQEDTGL